MLLNMVPIWFYFLFVILFDYLIILIWLIDGSPKMFLRSTPKLCTESTQTPRTPLLHLALLGQVGAPHMFCLNQRCWIYASIIMTLLLIHHVIHEEPYTLSPCYFHPEKNIDLLNNVNEIDFFLILWPWIKSVITLVSSLITRPYTWNSLGHKRGYLSSRYPGAGDPRPLRRQTGGPL